MYVTPLSLSFQLILALDYVGQNGTLIFNNDSKVLSISGPGKLDVYGSLFAYSTINVSTGIVIKFIERFVSHSHLLLALLAGATLQSKADIEVDTLILQSNDSKVIALDNSVFVSSIAISNQVTLQIFAGTFPFPIVIISSL